MEGWELDDELDATMTSPWAREPVEVQRPCSQPRQKQTILPLKRNNLINDYILLRLAILLCHHWPCLAQKCNKRMGNTSTITKHVTCVLHHHFTNTCQQLFREKRNSQLRLTRKMIGHSGALRIVLKNRSCLLYYMIFAHWVIIINIAPIIFNLFFHGTQVVYGILEIRQRGQSADRLGHSLGHHGLQNRCVAYWIS